MKVALLHDYLNQYGGAERVLECLLEIFPGAHIYTLLYSSERTSAKFQGNIHRTSILDFPLAWRKHLLFIPLMPLAARSLKIRNEYDLIISDSAGYARGFDHHPGTFHLSYCYAPLRYAWEPGHYFRNPLFKTLFRPVFAYLRRWDYRTAQKPNTLLAVSGYIAQKIRTNYRRTAAVLYPPIEYGRFYYDRKLSPAPDRPAYYLAAGRLKNHKRFDLLVEAFLKLGLNLWVVGTGPELSRIQNLAAGAKNIRFLHFVSDEELHALYSGAKALLFPQVEDFGLVAGEAQACGTPVIALARGGALEIVLSGQTGIFFQEQSVSSIVAAVRGFERMNFDREEIARLSRRFTIERFREGILNAIPAEVRAKLVPACRMNNGAR